MGFCNHFLQSAHFCTSLFLQSLFTMNSAVLLIFLVLGAASAHITVKTTSLDKPTKDFKFCGLCISVTGQTINQLLNIILNAGVVGGCGELCQKLDEKFNNSQIIGVLCDLACDYEGIEEFVKLIQKADLDPIYFCELIDVCDVKDDGDAKITSLKVPAIVNYGDDFEIDLMFTTTNGTGTGEVALNIETVDGMPLGDTELALPEQPGSYGVKWTVTAAPDPNCDPSQGFCEMWLPGNYTVIVAVCNGECGSKHPHSGLYDKAQAVFTLVKN